MCFSQLSEQAEIFILNHWMHQWKTGPNLGVPHSPALHPLDTARSQRPRGHVAAGTQTLVGLNCCDKAVLWERPGWQFGSQNVPTSSCLCSCPRADSPGLFQDFPGARESGSCWHPRLTPAPQGGGLQHDDSMATPRLTSGLGTGPKYRIWVPPGPHQVSPPPPRPANTPHPGEDRQGRERLADTHTAALLGPGERGAEVV